ncbi:hypothetical protein [Chryseolinea lacunae]|uniref:Uncharacterized protein n=1 Tax=Chryseolinea lacunae TaxID=2801331 RepID=A0ABS1KWE9_9BACT|nr:hypothetical protein [Chryseolinea lacunae]MBL0743760.1 hypothetical protein [Chryseolinea lacunae]
MDEKKVDLLLAIANTCIVAAFGLTATIYVEYRAKDNSMGLGLWSLLIFLSVFMAGAVAFFFFKVNNLVNKK